MSSLEDKFQSLKAHLGTQVSFIVKDMEVVFPDMKKSSLYWTISHMVKAGYLKRIRNGVYSINDIRGKSAVYLSETAEKAGTLLRQEGYEYYISGLDVIAKFMHHLPDQYPVIIFAEKKAETDILQLLQEHSIHAMKANAVREVDHDYVYTVFRPDVIIYGTENFEYVVDHVAVPEKAFIDLFYAVTRDYFPVALQELARIYSNMIRLGAVDQKKMITMSYKRNLQYDIRYIVENKYVSEGAKKFLEYVQEA